MASSKPFASSGNVGAAGELAFRVETLLRGHEVFIPQVDQGVDLLVNGKAVQVKSAIWGEDRRAWGFNFGRSRREGWECITDSVDFVALVGLRTDGWHAFWLVPWPKLKASSFQPTLSLGPAPARSGSRSPLSWVHEYRDAWHLLD